MTSTLGLRHRFLRLATLVASAVALVSAAGTTRFAQMVLEFPSKRPYQYDYDAAEQSIVLKFSQTEPRELAAVEHYDERLVRRVLIRDLGASGTELKLVLRDADVRATIVDYDEPFRVVIDLYDRQYQEERDPKSGLPVNAPVTSGAVDEHRPKQLLKGEPEALSRPSAAVPTPDPQPETPRRRALLAPVPEGAAPIDENESLAHAQSGPGKAWSEYPVYVYRIQTAMYRSGKEGRDLDQAAVKAMSSGEAMADYASRLFDFGHESRALMAYQQVLHKSPTVFNKDAVHLWKLGEIHLGQGNLLLADGYYQSEIEKHPDSPLAKFAAMRRLDVRAIRALKEKKGLDWNALANDLDAIKPGNNAELATQIAIRRSYWGQKDGVQKEIASNRHFLPSIQTSERANLMQQYPQVENQWTAFLAATLLLNHDLEQTKRWQPSSSAFAGDYLEKYKGPKVEPFRQQLEGKIEIAINETIAEHVAGQRHLEAVELVETLPPPLKDFGKSPKTAWLIGESYRRIGQSDKAALHYAVAAQGAKDQRERFRAAFWMARSVDDYLETGRAGGRAGEWKKAAQDADRIMAASWQDLKEDERATTYAELKPQLEAAVSGRTHLRTPAVVVLNAWDKALGSEVATPAGAAAKTGDTPSVQTIQLLRDLGQRFAQLGMRDERERSLKLLARLKPGQLDSKPETTKLWAKELMALAEQYRRDNNYLESGRLYTLVGTEAESWDGRAEALYKGGLLLYRAGRRVEAIEAFQKASQDANNLMYADLAKARLSQLQP